MRKVVISVAIAVLLVVSLTWLLVWRADRQGTLPAESTPAPRVVKKTAPAETAPEPVAVKKDGAGAAPSPEAAAVPILSGKVLDAEERPVAGARVAVRPPEDGSGGFEAVLRARALGRPAERMQLLAEAVSGPDGYYAVVFATPPRPGEYRVTARAPGFYPREETWWYEGTPSTLDLRLDEGGETIEGLVVDTAGSPIAAARVEASGDDEDRRGPPWERGGEETDRDLTDQEGKFRLVVAPGRYRVSARAEGFLLASVRGVEAGTRDVRLELGPARNLAGRVVDQRDNPVAQAAVVVYSLEDDGRRWGGGPPQIRRLFQEPAARGETWEDGSFQLVDLSLRGFLLEVKKGGFEAAEERGTLSQEGRDPPVEVRLKPGGILTGTVSDDQGKAVAGAVISLRNETAIAERRTASRERGAFDRFARFQGRGLGGVGPGGFRTGEGGPGGPGGFRGGAGAPGSGRQDQARDPSAPPSPVSIFSADAVAQTDSDGKFRFDTIARAVYTLSVESDRHVPLVKTPLEVLEQQVEVELKVDSGLKLSGRVVERAGGEPVAKATVRARTGDRDRRTVETDTEGRYTLEGLSPGRLREIQVRARGFTVLYADDLEVQAQPKEQTHDFALDRSASLAGRVVSAKGEPVAGARVRVSAVEGENMPDGGDDPNGANDREGGRDRFRRRRETERSARTDSQGAFKVHEVSAGPAFRSIVTHPDYQELRSDPFPVPSGAQVENLLYTLRSGGKVQVLALKPDRFPLANQRVELSRQREADQQGGDGRRGFQDRGFASSRTTSSEGRAVFGGLRGALYTVQVNAPGFQPFRQRDLSVVEDQVAEVTAQLLPENIITGVVMDSSGAPVPGAQLRATPAGERQAGGEGFGRGGPGGFGGRGGFGGGQPFGGEQSSRATAQPDGSFRLGGLGDGPYRVTASAEGFADQTLDRVEVNRSLEVKLLRRGAIQGVVMVGETGDPVTRFSVLLRTDRRSPEPAAADLDGDGQPDAAPGGANGPGGQSGRDRFASMRRSRPRDFEDAGGAFVLQDIDPGSYVLQVSAVDLSPREVFVRVTEGNTSGVQVLLYQGIVVAGLVTDRSTNGPVSGAQVLVYSAPEDRSQGPDQKKRAGVARVSQSAREALSEPSGGAGRRVGRAVAQAVTTDEAGGFGIRDVPAGKYILVVNHPDFVIAQEPFEIKAEGLTRDLLVGLEVGEELSGTITEADGRPSAGAVVRLRDQNSLEKRVLSDAAGRYLVRGLQPGTYTFSASSGGQTDRETLEIKKGDNRHDLKRAAASSG